MDVQNLIRLIKAEGYELRPISKLVPQRIRLKGSNQAAAESEFGQILFQHYPGKSFDIWYSIYDIRKPARLRVNEDLPVLELHTCFQNHFLNRANGLIETGMADRQFDLSYLPRIQTEAVFEKPGIYETFHIHFSEKFLESFRFFSTELADFLDKINKKKPVSLINKMSLLPPDMSRIIGEILNHEFSDNLSPLFYEFKVRELILQLLNYVAPPLDHKFSVDAIQMAREAESILLSEPEMKYSYSALAHRVGANKSLLKNVFRHVYGCSMFKYGEKARMALARQLLKEDKLTISAISMKVGYPDAQNFAAAFKRNFKQSPGAFRKRVRSSKSIISDH